MNAVPFTNCRTWVRNAVTASAMKSAAWDRKGDGRPSAGTASSPLAERRSQRRGALGAHLHGLSVSSPPCESGLASMTLGTRAGVSTSAERRPCQTAGAAAVTSRQRWQRHLQSTYAVLQFNDLPRPVSFKNFKKVLRLG